MTVPSSILAGIDGLIDAWCGLSDPVRYGETPRHASRQAAIDLSEHGGPLGSSAGSPDAAELFRQILEKSGRNHAAAGGRQASSAAWSLRKTVTLSPDSTSPEKILEKLVVQLLGDQWSNQVPTASGLVPNADTHRNVDLVHDCGDGAFEFIELKYGTADQNFGSNHPLYAAWEVVLYALLYVHARLNREHEDSRPLLQAKRIHLRVLAPEGYYRYARRGDADAPFDLAWLERAINKGLKSLPLADAVTIDFAFQKFTKDFDAIYELPQPLPTAAQAFRRADLGDRQPVYA
mgnify:CR=1 FL=1